MIRYLSIIGTIVLSCSLQMNAAAANYLQRQTLAAPASGQGAPARGFGTQVAVDGDLAVVADLASTLSIRPAIVRTYVRNAGVWTRQAQELGFNTGSPSNRIKLALGDDTLALMYPGSTPGSTQARIYRRVNGQWQLEESFGVGSTVYESIAAEGNTVVLGHPGPSASNPNFTSGYIRIYRRDSNGDWSGTQVTASPLPDNARFGQSVAIAAGGVAVGAPDEDVSHSGNGTLYTDAGAAYVFELTGSAWNQAARLVEPDNNLWHGAKFGTAVAISGANPATPDRLLVSSFRRQSSVGGNVRSYTRTSGVWTARQVFSSNIDDCWGCVMSLDGDWAVLGAPTSHTTANFSGKVTVLRFSSNFTSLISQTDRFDSLGTTNDAMGSTVSIDRSGPTMFVGAPGAEVYGNGSEGVVMIGRGGDGGDPVPRAVRTLDLGQGLTNSTFGTSIATDADTLAIGAPQEDIGLQPGRGAVYVMERDGSGQYTLSSRLLAPDGASDDIFGYALAMKGDSLLIGASGRGVQGLPEAGMVYAYRRSAGQWNLEAQLISPTPTNNGGFGQGLAFDGTTAVICGRFEELSWIFERNTGGSWTWTQTVAHRCSSPQLSGGLLLLNDLFGDGSGADVGKVATFTRSGGQWQLQGALTGNSPGQRFGLHIAMADDLLTVSSNGSAALPLQVFRRTGSNWLPEVSLFPNDATSSSSCVASAVHAGRVALGCLNQPGPSGPGATYLFEKVGGNWTQSQKLTIGNARDGDRFGDVLAFHPDGTLFAAATIRAIDFFGQGAVYRYSEPSPLLFANGFE